MEYGVCVCARVCAHVRARTRAGAQHGLEKWIMQRFRTQRDQIAITVAIDVTLSPGTLVN